MDLNQLDTVAVGEAGVAMQLKHPTTGEPLAQENGEPITITLAGADSDRFRSAQRANADRRIKNARRNSSSADIEADGLELLASATLGWSGIKVDGEALDANKANVKKVYTRFPWIREQVDVFIGDRANFLPSVAKS